MTDYMVVLPPEQRSITLYLFVCEVCGEDSHRLWEDSKLLLEYFDCLSCGHRVSLEEATRRPGGAWPQTWLRLSLEGLDQKSR